MPSPHHLEVPIALSGYILVVGLKMKFPACFKTWMHPLPKTQLDACSITPRPAVCGLVSIPCDRFLLLYPSWLIGNIQALFQNRQFLSKQKPRKKKSTTFSLWVSLPLFLTCCFFTNLCHLSYIFFQAFGEKCGNQEAIISLAFCLRPEVLLCFAVVCFPPSPF